MTTIDLITGILGAGKTTFIRKYAANLLAQGKKIAILDPRKRLRSSQR